MRKILSICRWLFFLFAILLFLSGCDNQKSVLNNTEPLSLQTEQESSVDYDEIERLLESYFSKIEERISDIESKVSTETTKEVVSDTSIDSSLSENIHDIESKISALYEISAELKNLYAQLEQIDAVEDDGTKNSVILKLEVLEENIDSFISLQNTKLEELSLKLDAFISEITEIKTDLLNQDGNNQFQDEIDSMVKELKEAVDSFYVTQDLKIQGISSDLSLILSDIKNLKLEIEALKENSSDLESIINSLAENTEEDVTDVSTVPTQSTQIEESSSQTLTAETTTVKEDNDGETIVFQEVESLGEEEIRLSVTATQKYYYKISLYDERFEFELSEYSNEPSVEFFEDEDLSLPIELNDSCLPSTVDGYVYMLISSECDDEIVFFLRSIA